jgi:hypothetical protein
MTTRMMTARTKSHLVELMGVETFSRKFRLIRSEVQTIHGELRTVLVFEVRS